MQITNERNIGLKICRTLLRKYNESILQLLRACLSESLIVNPIVSTQYYILAKVNDCLKEDIFRILGNNFLFFLTSRLDHEWWEALPQIEMMIIDTATTVGKASAVDNVSTTKQQTRCCLHRRLLMLGNKFPATNNPI